MATIGGVVSTMVPTLTVTATRAVFETPPPLPP
jgi:hypothetical protein